MEVEVRPTEKTQQAAYRISNPKPHPTKSPSIQNSSLFLEHHSSNKLDSAAGLVHTRTSPQAQNNKLSNSIAAAAVAATKTNSLAATASAAATACASHMNISSHSDMLRICTRI